MKQNKNAIKALNSRGVTLIELIIVIVIIGIISTFTVLSVSTVLRDSKENIQELNMNTVKNYIDEQLILGGFSDDQIYSYKRSGTEGNYFSTFLEKSWEVTNGPGDEDNTNILNFTNSLSGKYGVVNWNDAKAIGDDLYCNQSLYITTASDTSYEVANPSVIDSCYAGSIIIWYDGNNADNIILYFVDNDGLQTEEHYIYSKED